MLSRRFFLGGLISAPAVIAADKLMPVRSIVKPWATVYGVGWDYEVVEIPVWSPMSASQFGAASCHGGHIEKFREVTSWVYSTAPPPLPPVIQRANPIHTWFANERKAIVDETTGFTNVTGFDALKEFKAKQNVKMFEATKHLNIVGIDQSVA